MIIVIYFWPFQRVGGGRQVEGCHLLAGHHAPRPSYGEEQTGRLTEGHEAKCQEWAERRGRNPEGPEAAGPQPDPAQGARSGSEKTPRGPEGRLPPRPLRALEGRRPAAGVGPLILQSERLAGAF